MPDVAWCGGISELRRIASMAEVYYTRVSPHDALGTIAIAAGLQACMAIPNLYRQECIHTWFPVFEKIITPALDVRGGSMYPNYKPGIGFDLKWDEIEKYRVDPEDPFYTEVPSSHHRPRRLAKYHAAYPVEREEKTLCYQPVR